jgi:hypothetical protein
LYYSRPDHGSCSYIGFGGRAEGFSRGFWESANAAKVSAEKAAKSAETGAKKAEKALADAQQKQAKREQSMAERLDKISVSVGSKCRTTPFWILT